MVSKKIGIIGAGGFGKEVHKLLHQINSNKEVWNICGYFDENLKKGSYVNGLPVLGNNEEALDNKEIDNFVIAICNPLKLLEIGKRILESGKALPNVVYPGIDLDLEFNEIGYGNVITYGFYLTRNITIGNLNIFNTRVTLGHDVVIGSYNVFYPNVQISGNNHIGDRNVFGMNSSVIQQKKIGSDNIIGAHSLIVTSIKDSKHYFGVPAKIFTFEAV